MFGRSLFRFRVSFQRCSSERATFLFVQLIELEIVTRALLMKGAHVNMRIMKYVSSFCMCLLQRHRPDSNYLVNKLVLFQATLFQTPVMCGPQGIWSRMWACDVAWSLSSDVDEKWWKHWIQPNDQFFPKISWILICFIVLMKRLLHARGLALLVRDRRYATRHWLLHIVNIVFLQNRMM